MIIKVLGTGCPKCQRLEQMVREALTAGGVQAKIEHVRDINDIMAYPILSTPGLVIDEQLVCSGRLPRKEELTGWLASAAAR